ncbi:MEDS domain-containing protein [Clostridium sp.]|uniref:MEDS domain-containing protein n=1 Tax=Clostridium sp. TaxID=1506 RepID=UPI00321735B4
MNNFFGKNICFYYYGEDHLVMNLYKYIKQQIENNNYVYLYVGDDIHKLLLNNLDENEKNMVELIDVEKSILNSRTISTGFSSTSIYLNNLKSKVISKGFWGVNFIIDSSKLLNTTCESTFMDFIKELSIICEKNQLNILACYDFLDYINRGKTINENIMKSSYDYHDYRMFGNEIIPIENFKINSNLA